jgi:hypothetical protein
LFTNPTDIGNESKTNACHGFAGQLPVQFTRPTLQPRSPEGCGIHGHGPVTPVLMGLPLPALLNLLPKPLH